MDLEISAPFADRDLLGEGPLWDCATGRLLRIDHLGRSVHSLDIHSGAQESFFMPEGVAFCVPTTDGDLLVGQRDSVVLTDRAGKPRRTVLNLGLDADLRLNDGKADPRGRLVFGSLSEAREARGAAYRLGATTETIAENVVISNGLAWDLERRRFYYVDSWTARIDVFDLDPDDGSVRNRRPFADVPRANGNADGICVDAEGCLWAPLFGGGLLRRFRPDGSLDLEVALPVSHPTSVAFGGDDFSLLFVTSSRHRLSADEQANQPLAGALLILEPEVTGTPEFVADTTGW